MSHLRTAVPTRKTLEVGFALVSALLSEHVNRIVNEPYMDEIFHIPQAQAYCHGKWDTWDPKLTTPPGIYLLSNLLARGLQYIHLPLTCLNLNFLRSTNLVLYLILPHLIVAIRQALLEKTKQLRMHHGRATTAKARGARIGNTLSGQLLHHVVDEMQRSELVKTVLSTEAHAITSFPPLWFFAFLYYTDVGSFVVVLASYFASLKERLMVSALFALVSLTFRQTNVIWVAFIMWTVLLRRLKECGLHDPLAAKATRSSMLEVIKSGMRVFRKSSTWRRVSGSFVYLPVFAAFALFLKINNGIVLGDKTNHVAGLHFPQLFYFTASSTVFAWPSLLRAGPMRLARSTFQSLVGSRSAFFSTILLLVTIAASVRYFTIFHPFVLADNRHYPFYIRKRVLDWRPWTRYAAIPTYLVCTVMWWNQLAQTQTLLWLIGFIASTALTLVPSPLIEPRYFLVPYVLMRLHSPLPPGDEGAEPPTQEAHGRGSEWAGEMTHWMLASFIELACNILIHGVTMYIFLHRPFRSPFEPGLQRFMW
ncbi:glycosyltransferase family 59 protein [Tilletiaria anomala UBC 951]|uniref:Dol-P-Glc:Glc(2)Man(9)GlcNAc(2)-PP-Dol alpha-1,2-glucosyltransferase n=1 Tax=Tilletiaria anomala (strain ATCC 24038 / CBS 436.72 / UBC 951) TaxID=1037660 RepID=A0A066VFV9_TILAU|nr:glycosyltransferase family 59 protein [Tilletiaria anomala UBC 951]KDN37455.1 glycosyltransferase family 59 protein [Tilletiaria anomala UBC 951]